MLRVYTPGLLHRSQVSVLYLLTAWATPAPNGRSGRARPIIIDNLLAEKKVAPFIIVFPSGNATATPADEKQGDRAQASYGLPTTRTS